MPTFSCLEMLKSWNLGRKNRETKKNSTRIDGIAINKTGNNKINAYIRRSKILNV